MSVYGLKIPNVSVTLASPGLITLTKSAAEVPLFATGEEWALAAWRTSLEERLHDRDWPELRNELLSLRLSDRDLDDAAIWLNRVGYIPESATDISTDGSRDWIAEEVTPAIVSWLRQHRAAIEWLFSLEHSAFVEAIEVASAWLPQMREEWGKSGDENLKRVLGNPKAGPRRPREPNSTLARRLMLPQSIDPDILRHHLIGAGKAPSLFAIFRWGREGKPEVNVMADTPMVAISLSTHIDRNFSKLRQAFCDYCHQPFVQEKSSERFCIEAHRHRWHNDRKALRVRLIRDKSATWLSLPAPARRGLDPWEWIAERVNEQGLRDGNGEIGVTAALVERTLENTLKGKG
jgi:hypothetical protein